MATIFQTSIGKVELVPIPINPFLKLKCEPQYEVYHAETDEYFGIYESASPNQSSVQEHINNYYKTKFNH